MSSFSTFLGAAPVVILDGGLASELERHGADLRDPLWSAKMLLDNPGLIRHIHEDYFRAGADVGTSASYQASYLGFTRRGVSPKRAGELLRLSVRLVREARDHIWNESPAHRARPLVAASIGCFGATLADGSEYRGVYDLGVDELVDWHRPRLDTLLEENPDVLACETVPCLKEAEALARLLAEYQTPAWVSACCRDDEHLSSGEPFIEALQIWESLPNIVAVGFNCTPPVFAEQLVAVAKRHTRKRVVAYPNSGEAWDAERKQWQGRAATLDWGEAGLRWHAAGATLLGGCCRTTPDDIGRLRAALWSKLQAW
jgi:homocysteine S-methyltransferase